MCGNLEKLHSKFKLDTEDWVGGWGKEQEEKEYYRKAEDYWTEQNGHDRSDNEERGENRRVDSHSDGSAMLSYAIWSLCP